MKNDTQHASTSLIVLLGIACIVAFGGYTLLVVSGNRASARATLLQQEVMVQSQREARVGNTEKLLEDVRNEQEHIASFFVSRNNVVSAIETLEGLGGVTRTTVTLADVTLSGESTTAPDVLTIRLTGTGSWANVAHLLSLLEHLPFHAELVSVSLNTSPGSDAPSIWTLQATLQSRLIE